MSTFAAAALLCWSESLHAQSGVEAWFAPGEAVTNAIAVSYKFRVIQDTAPLIVILFGWNRLYGPSNETYLLENDAYADGFAFTNPVCTTWPEIGTELFGQSSLRSDIPDYNEHGWIGARSDSPAMFPRQSYWIDGIQNLQKMDLITQTNLNGVECSVQLNRAGLVTDLTGWNCANLLDTNVTFREWDATISFSGATFTNRFAVPDANGQYFASYEIFDFLGEFFWRTTGVYQVYIYDLEIQREGDSWWRRLNQFNVYRVDNWPTNNGVRVVNDGGANVIEMSANIGLSTNYFQVNTVFDLGVSLDGEAPDLVPVTISAPAIAFAGDTIPVTVTISNATAFAAGGFATGLFLSSDSVVTLNDALLGGTTNTAGLAGQGSLMLTNFIIIPSTTAPGVNYLGAIADYLGDLVETVKSNNTAAVPITILVSLPSGGAGVTNTWSLPADFALDGWQFEDMPDSRPGGSPGGGTNMLVNLTFAGDLANQNGTITNEGPGYTGSDYFPYVMLDTNNDWLILHPASNHGASVGFAASRTGVYHLHGVFARANDFQFAGDGVDVVVIRNLDTTNVLFSASIPSSAAVDLSNLFQGPGAAPFALTLSLLKGDVIRFVVFSGTNGDFSFDATALTFTATQDPAPPFSLSASLAGQNLLIGWPALADEAYQVFASTNLLSWTPIAQLSSAGTNRLFWTTPVLGQFQAFRVQLQP